MKIGILTYHKAYNYGAVLQAIATRIVLQGVGHEVFYIDYWPKYHIKKYDILCWELVLKMLAMFKFKFVFKYFDEYVLRKERKNNFESFMSQYIIPFCRNISKYDVIIYGSDQIWRKQSTGDYNPVYFAKNDYASDKHISYAASIGIIPQNEFDKNTIKELIANFDSISVREIDLKDFVCNMGYKAELVLDPTLLLSANDWDNVLGIDDIVDEPYLLYYNLQKDAFAESEIQKFATEKRVKIKMICGTAHKHIGIEDYSTCDPRKFVSLIKNAKYVFTSSFHGLAFSIIYGKQFWASFPANAGRALSLLETIGAEDRILGPNQKIPIDACDLNFCNVFKRLEFQKHLSLSFLLKEVSHE